MPERSVLHLLGPSTGGIRQHVAELHAQLTGLGWSSSVAGPSGVMDGLLPSSSAVPVPSSWDPRLLLRARRSLRGVVGGRSLVHAHGLKAALVALSLGRRRPPVVLTVHNLVEGTHSGRSARLLGLVQGAIVRRADHLIVLSDESLAVLDPLVPADRRTLVMPLAPRPRAHRSAGDVRAEYGIPLTAPLVVVAARHHPQKDLPMFLRAFASVRRSMPDARALLVGDGPERPIVERTRAMLDLDDAVVLAGHRPSAADELAAADAVAVSSRWEAGPLVSVECLQLGRPLVTTAVGAVCEHLVDGEHARVVPVGDVDAFASALVDVLSDRVAAERMAATGHRLALERFDPSILVRPVVAAYDTTLHSPRRRMLRR